MEDNIDQSVTYFLQQLQEGNRDGTDKLWNHFYTRLVTLARKKLDGRVRVVDGEDVALRALDECFRQLEEGRYPSIKDRDNLWALLATITERKALNANRDELCDKRGGGKVRGESVFLRQDDSICIGADAIPGQEPTPQLVAEFAEEFEKRLSQLNEKEREVALHKLKGLKNREIAEQLDCSIASVERKLNLIRSKWDDADDAPSTT